MSAQLWAIALQQIRLRSFYGKQEATAYAIRNKRDLTTFVGPPRNMGKRAHGPSGLPCILEWFINNPDDTITVDDLAVKFNITVPTAYRIQRILFYTGEIFRHTRPGRKKGIQYGRTPPVIIPTKKDLRPEPERKYVRKVPI